MKTFGILYAIGALLLGIFSAGGEKPLFDETDLLADSNGAGGVIFSAGGGEKTYKIPEGMSAMGILLYDLRDGEALVAKNPDYVFPIASLSKIMTGLLSLEWKKGAADAEIRDYVLSCRVMGRRVEESLLYTALRFAREHCAPEGIRRVVARYVPTAKNKPCLEFFQTSGFRLAMADSSFSWETSKEYPLPAGIKIVP